MDPLLERIKESSRYESWKGKTSDPTTRYHHRLVPPPLLVPGYRVVAVDRPLGQRPALDKIFWHISTVDSTEVAFTAIVSQFGAIESAHEAMLGPIMSITRTGVDYTPVSTGPGDIRILDEMARDNVMIRITSARPDQKQRIDELLLALDRWLVSDWPRTAGHGPNPKPPLLVELSAASRSIARGAPLAVSVRVRSGNEAMDVLALHHRLIATPGRIERVGDAYVYRCDRPGPATIGVEVLSQDGRYGEATLRLNAGDVESNPGSP